MEINRRFTKNVIEEMAAQIEQAHGNEVFFAGKINEQGVVISVSAAARGNSSSVPVNFFQARECSVLIHNHPSSNLSPSRDDLSVASNCSENAQGFYIINNSVTEVYAVMEPVLPRTVTPLDAEQTAFYLSKDGPFAKKSDSYEERPVQLSLVKKITECFNKNKTGVFEAGTGVGKSFSYLIPSILWAIQNKERIVISTGTINLQQQIIEKDIPQSEKILDVKIKAVLVKGRQNYVCLRRLEETGKERELFNDEQEFFDKIYDWSKTSPTGSRSELPFMPPENVWQRVNSESDACLGLKCPFREKCFVMKVRKEAADANILVVNHHLLFADIESRLEGAGYEDAAVLPPYKRIVFDEAHGIEEAATSFFSSQLNKFKLLKQLNLMHRSRRNSFSGYIFTLMALSNSEDESAETVGNIARIKKSLEEMEQNGFALLENDSTFRFFPENKKNIQPFLSSVKNLQTDLAGFIGKIRSLFDKIHDDEKDSPVLYEIRAVLRRLENIVLVLGNFLIWDEKTDEVFWLQKSRLSSSQKNGEVQFYLQLNETPLVISNLMVKGVFEPMDSVVCTSATLSISTSFEFWKRKTGVSLIEKSKISEGVFPSSFPYKKNVLFAVAKDAPLPENTRLFQEYIQNAIVKLIEAAGGRTLVLFTSYDSLRYSWDIARTQLRSSGISLLKQGDEDRFKLLSNFKKIENSVLFATDSFWEGVDVPGKSLSQVIIVKLPFGVPSDPVFAARSQLIKNRGGYPFMELSVPEAVIKFRQGFGRLMRRSDDRGAVIVLDKRIVETNYGRIFTSSVPETKKMYAELTDIVSAVKSHLEE